MGAAAHESAKYLLMWYSPSMQVLDRKLQQRVKRVSKKTGLPEREIIERAVSSYLGNLEDVAALQKELRVWDILSAKTMQKYSF